MLVEKVGVRNLKVLVEVEASVMTVGRGNLTTGESEVMFTLGSLRDGEREQGTE